MTAANLQQNGLKSKESKCCNGKVLQNLDLNHTEMLWQESCAEINASKPQ